MGHSGWRAVLVGVGALRSPRYRAAVLLVRGGAHQVMLDGGGAEQFGRLDAWLVCDLDSEEMPAVRRRCRESGIRPRLGTGRATGWSSRPGRWCTPPTPPAAIFCTRGHAGGLGTRVLAVSALGGRADLMFADAAGWRRPIRFAGGVGGHAAMLDTAGQARRTGVRRLIFAHIGRPCIRAQDAGEQPPFGE